ncbi:MAG TPA: hypothetical protein VLV78_06730 [Thermoanaerobaculia bacterium]|nr:hypothetical protein [Thermoanaerobaculia bacterium]
MSGIEPAVLGKFAVVLSLLAALFVSPLQAGSVSEPMQVSVQVLARAIVTVTNQLTVTITPDDLARGYIDVTSPIVLLGRTNSRRGYMLQVQKTSEEFTTVDLTLPDATMSISSHDGFIQRPYVQGGDVVPVAAHLVLSPTATAGTHVLPISFSASPL